MVEAIIIRRFIVHFILTIGVLSAASASAQPFGISMGTPQEMLLVKEANVDPGFHKLHSVPRPHSEFEDYYVTAGGTSGVCAIRALGNDYENDDTGKAVRGAFDTVKSQLDSRYGESRTDYYLKPESNLDEPDKWVQSIAEYDRIHRAIWDTKSGATTKNDVEAIVLIVQASQALGRAYLFLEYRYSNYDACQKEIVNSDNDAL